MRGKAWSASMSRRQELPRPVSYTHLYFAELDSAKNWVRQLHVGALRNPNGAALRDLGPDTGFDAIADFTYMAPLGRLLDRSAQQGTLPRTILYNLNPVSYTHLIPWAWWTWTFTAPPCP